MHPLRIAATLTLALIASSVSAQMHKWIDDEGITHYSDTAPEDRPTLEIKGEISSYTTPSVEPLPDDFFARDKPATHRSKSVVMYSAEWCGVCRRAKKYFGDNNIAYQEKDIDKSDQARREYEKLGAKGVPVILVGTQRMNGFSEAGFQQLYSKQ